MRQGRHRKTRNGLAFFAALVAVLVQAFVIQTHVDGLGALGVPAHIEASGKTAAPAIAVSGAQTKAEAACPICQAAATAGRTLIAPTVTLPQPPRASQSDPLTQIVFSVARPAHAWRSRAPPAAL